MGRRLLLRRLVLRSQPLPSRGEPQNAVCGISAPFGTLSPAKGQIIYVLRTRAPLSGVAPFSCDLHVLGAPLTFALSQDQTLQLLKLLSHCVRRQQRIDPASLSFRITLDSENRCHGGVVDRHNLSRCTELNPCVYVSLRFSFQRPKPALSLHSASGEDRVSLRGGRLSSCPSASVNS